jgi:hypothetical protein
MINLSLINKFELTEVLVIKRTRRSLRGRNLVRFGIGRVAAKNFNKWNDEC